MRIVVSSIYVDDQDKALAFYTKKLGFVKKTDIPLGAARWLTVVAPNDRDGTELVLEPDGHPAVGPFSRYGPHRDWRLRKHHPGGAKKFVFSVNIFNRERSERNSILQQGTLGGSSARF